MKIAFFGSSHAAQHLSRAAAEKGFEIVAAEGAELVFVSEDTPTAPGGRRDLEAIKALCLEARRTARRAGAPLVLTSAVPPGFTRALEMPEIFHQAETLRIKDAAERARSPEMLIVGSADPEGALPAAYATYLAAFGCPVLRMTWEEAEFAKVAINCTLAMQVENTNTLASAAKKVGARWEVVAGALKRDGRIGPKSYLEPGMWGKSTHLVRDMKTLSEILG